MVSYNDFVRKIPMEFSFLENSVDLLVLVVLRMVITHYSSYDSSNV